MRRWVYFRSKGHLEFIFLLVLHCQFCRALGIWASIGYPFLGWLPGGPGFQAILVILRNLFWNKRLSFGFRTNTYRAHQSLSWSRLFFGTKETFALLLGEIAEFFDGSFGAAYIFLLQDVYFASELLVSLLLYPPQKKFVLSLIVVQLKCFAMAAFPHHWDMHCLQEVERATWQKCYVTWKLKMVAMLLEFIQWMTILWLKLRRSGFCYVSS